MQEVLVFNRELLQIKAFKTIRILGNAPKRCEIFD